MRWISSRPTVPATEQSSDEVLLRAVAGRDNEALRVLHQRHAPWLRARLARRCADPDVVDAAVQDTFMAVWRGAHRYVPADAAVAGWLWTIAIRRLISALRGPAHRWAADAELEVQIHGARSPSAEEVVLLGVEHGDVGAALTRLSPELRAVIQASVIDGLTMREAAVLLGVPEGTVKTRLMRARAQLREHLT